MNKIEFPICSSCTDCILCETAKSPGLPTRLYTVSEKPKALLVVGQSPGFHEDKQGESWVGYAGKLLSTFIDSMSLADEVDIYLSNACRCVVTEGEKIQHSNINKCRKWLAEDLRLLSEQYSEIIILACGSAAAYSVGKFSSLKTALKFQGTQDAFPESFAVPITSFFTYHPAILHPSRKPALVKAVKAHFDLLSRYLRGKFIPNIIAVFPMVGKTPPPQLPPVVSVDIETYGALAGGNQSVFLPVKSKIVDGVDYPDQIVTVSFAYRDETGEIQTPIYIYKNKAHKELIRRWFDTIIKQKCILIGQNIKFDLRYLADTDKFLSFYINPLRLRVNDTLLMSFLLYEQQPEKGLKELATLFGITDYTESKKILGRAKHIYDPKLHEYNCKDSAATLVLYEECLSRIKEQFGPDSPKLSNVCFDMCNTIIWDTFELEKNGVALNTPQLLAFHNEIQTKCDAIVEDLSSAGVISMGTGSYSSLRELISESFKECNLLGDKRVVFTNKKREIAIKKENISLLLSTMPDDNPHKKQLEALQLLRTHNKTLSSYTLPLLNSTRKGITYAINNDVSLIHPTWYPIPSYHNRGGSEEEKEGGTIQGRFSAQKPSIPTFPPSILKCLTTRYPAGLLVGYDFNQMELRSAAMQSGDPPLLEAYRQGLDLHLLDAPVIFPSLDLNSPGIKDSKERHLLKTLNFLMLYRGGAYKYQETARRNLGLELDIDFCRETIRQWYTKHHYFKEWQDKLIADVQQKGYMELPTGWSRTFAMGSSADIYVNEICNYPIQTLSAQLCQSAQFELLCCIHRMKWETKQVCNTYDSIMFDVPESEEQMLDEAVQPIFKHPPLMSILEEHFGRTVPIEFDKKIYARNPVEGE